MAQIIQRVKKIGGSIMIRIPSEIADIEHIMPGEAVQIDIVKLRKDWFGASPGLTPFKKEERFKSKYE